jgi:hypothetical protein
LKSNASEEKRKKNWVVLSATLAKDKELDATMACCLAMYTNCEALCAFAIGFFFRFFQEWHKDDAFIGVKDFEGGFEHPFKDCVN